ncbi:type IIL restriction-modification enzyme MmeI [Paraburkholderia agricolaris]|uniref:type IIL restriction-modification enzyme MmeI n=1 Tax=Paraburkholderia agricolaris TaxID=2152888 RepID=UPI0038BD7AF1
MNHFMARLIFSLFAEDVGSFDGSGLLTKTVDRMSETTSTDAVSIFPSPRSTCRNVSPHIGMHRRSA